MQNRLCHLTVNDDNSFRYKVRKYMKNSLFQKDELFIA
jgi:hypothetical protein